MTPASCALALTDCFGFGRAGTLLAVAVSWVSQVKRPMVPAFAASDDGGRCVSGRDTQGNPFPLGFQGCLVMISFGLPRDRGHQVSTREAVGTETSAHLMFATRAQTHASPSAQLSLDAVLVASECKPQLYMYRVTV